MKLKIFYILLLSGLTWSKESGNNKATHSVQFDKTESSHISPFLHSTLELSPGDLKLFVGHSLNMLLSKCPSVDAKKIFQIQKYIGKVLAVSKEAEGGLTNVKTSNKDQFDNLINSITTCTRTKGDEHVEKAPFGRKVNSGISFILRKPNGAFTVIRTGEAYPMRSQSKVETQKSELVVLGLNDEEISSAPHLPAGMGKPVVINKTKTTNDKNKGFVKWASSIYDKVAHFFSSVFAPIRRRRSTDNGVFVKDIKISSVHKWIDLDKAKGKKGIFSLVNEICRIYCSKCTRPLQIQNFKMASKEFMDYVVKDENILIAASHLLDESLLESIKACGPIHVSSIHVGHS